MKPWKERRLYVDQSWTIHDSPVFHYTNVSKYFVSCGNQGHHHLPETRGLCLSEEQTVSTILRRPRMAGNKVMEMITEPYRLTRRCEVTAILILYGLPR
jgi:hypothetical protein